MRRILITTLALNLLVCTVALGGEMVSLINGNGFGNPNNIGLVHMETHEGRLYAATWNRVDGCLVYVTEDGESWTPVAMITTTPVTRMPTNPTV